MREGEVNLESEYIAFKERVKDFQLVPVEEEKQIEVKPYQLRVLSCSVPRYWLVTLGVEYSTSGLNLYKVLVLTEDVSLAQFADDVPVLLIKKIMLASLPFWVYLTDEFLREYSVYFTDLSEELVDCIFKWVEKVELPSVDNVRGKYIIDMLELTSWWNVNSIMDVVDDFEMIDTIM
ncbi:MAG: hypothetical protein JHC26_11660 [Thermofilum sp.]|uniref:hypothetical protein n=1 Tax=Thermofilum sp. TaxID=1961369 RepID=UPI002587DFB6|nr:hypothetical protein [Thermofilum sp.]MCI4409739.1 hypothetical protein [Thermofilum sp.]